MNDTERTVRVAAALLGIHVTIGRHTGLIHINAYNYDSFRTWEEALKFLTKLKGQEKPK